MGELRFGRRYAFFAGEIGRRVGSAFGSLIGAVVWMSGLLEL